MVMQHDKYYQVIYRQRNKPVLMVMVAQFIGYVTDGTLNFDLRPLTRRRCIDSKQVIHVQEAQKNEPQLPRII